MGTKVFKTVSHWEKSLKEVVLEGAVLKSVALIVEKYLWNSSVLVKMYGYRYQPYYLANMSSSNKCLSEWLQNI